ncbi:hypothetical protein CAI21_16195 [Alkalilimnicola ehrlichii]|uniref:Permease n=1 Tax=Alkalilimnicola ehrlichii TaxID=351052 RepID=A0A3E0WPM8_9GAMM|nr:SO_0444 family Cu/Zn efflux transporter [Alkalilimnicola ehrlichii]RFA26821.1 hypothetical protein CAI21_16195 [Alkalilimnicola ehrlichii]RFA33915.1 hypothetical protein CAL65_16320 [Alkalilimnicola ehrlichii]
MTVFNEILAVALTAAPWLLAGLFAAGLIKALIPQSLLQRWVGGRGLLGIGRAAVIGAPLPLCSCGAIPTALTLHRGGAGRGPTTAFLIGTPSVGVDSIALTYALLGPFMVIARAGGAVVTAITTGVMVAFSERRDTIQQAPAAAPAGTCCASDCGDHSKPSAPATQTRLSSRLQEGMRYAFSDLLQDIGGWILAGLIIAGVIVSFVPPEAMANYGSGILPMLLLAIIGIPLYICASAATPIAAGMLLAGVSPGTALVFLLAGPVTSMATLAVLRKELGTPALAYYLGGIFISTITLGLLTDQLASLLGVNVVSQVGAAHELLPAWLAWSSLFILIALGVRPYLRRLIKR